MICMAVGLAWPAPAEAGATWYGDQHMCPDCKNVQGQNDPEIKVGADGIIYASWMNDYDVVFSRSDDHGRTWTRPIDLRRCLRRRRCISWFGRRRTVSGGAPGTT
jgi:hypothetical protein